MAISRATAIFKPQLGTAGPRPAERAARSGPGQDTVASPAGHIRRCTFRRVTALPHGRRELPVYDVDCMHPSYDKAVPLGNLAAAHSACKSCTLPGIFRPDED